MANLVPDITLMHDLETGNVPNFAFIAQINATTNTALRVSRSAVVAR
jgi:hypothetical protein